MLYVLAICEIFAVQNGAWPTLQNGKMPMIANTIFIYIIRGWIKLIRRLGLSSTNKLVSLSLFFPFLSSLPIEVGQLLKSG